MELQMEKYTDLHKQDLLEPIRPLLEKGTYKFNQHGKLESELRMAPGTPWIHVRQDARKNCGMWHQIWFNFYGIVPSYCQNCWKVVIRPTTFKELLMLYEILVELDRPSKCGIERRDSVPGLYGGYMYNDTLEDGQECYEVITKEVNEKIGPHVKTILKRACTEFEHKFQNARYWEVSEYQKKLESALEKMFVDYGKIHDQPLVLQKHVMANWMKFAFAHGDPSVNEFLTEPLYPPYDTFHDNPEVGKKPVEELHPDEV